MVSKSNLVRALKHIERNQDESPGIDGMEPEELRDYLRANWPEIEAKVLEGTYEPNPLRWKEIQKEGEGKRLIGIPTVADKFIQQALLQKLTRIFDAAFSKQGYGFRPNRSAHQAVSQAKEYIQDGDLCTR